MMTKPSNLHRRFFFHYNKQQKCMSVHHKNKCLLTDNVLCLVPTETKDNKQQPRKTVQGWCLEVNHTKSLTTIK